MGANLAASLRITLATIALSLLLAVRTTGAPRRAALSAALYVAYTVSVGGDFMSGRLLSGATLLVVLSALSVAALRGSR